VLTDGRTELSRHRKAGPAKTRKRPRTGVFLLVTAVLMAGTAGAGAAAYVARSHAGGSDPAALVVAGIPASRSVLLLEQDRQHMILMDAASRTLTVVGSPKLATRPSVVPSQGASPDPSTSTSTGTPPTVSAPPPNPGTAQSIAYKMLSSFGWNPSTYYGCLNNIWSRESGWRYDAENASGAYGIPQALPGSKMASAGPDWQTNPATQIKWGLGYIQGRYGDPCSAWSFWEGHGWY
jgi:hypothetical protein